MFLAIIELSFSSFARSESYEETNEFFHLGTDECGRFVIFVEKEETSWRQRNETREMKREVLNNTV